MKRNILIWTLGILAIFILFYLELPPINLRSPLFWHFIFTSLIIVLLCLTLSDRNKIIVYNHFNFKLFSIYKYLFLLIGGLFLILLFINLVYSPLISAKKYSERIIVNEDNEFISDIEQVNFSSLPLIDRDSSQKLGDRKMGEFTSWVSQFYVSDLYTQINYQEDIVRVTPIEYASFIKYLTNRKDGIKGYITVNSVTGSANLVSLDEGMKYMPSAYFFENLFRMLRFKYPTLIFDEASFEIDNEGKPYWIVPTIKYHGIGKLKDINGIIIVDPVNGKSKRYDLKDVPSWVDHVYNADLIIEQVNDWGTYKNGFLNSIFGQKGVVNTTEGYNYLVMDDDVFLYTGITSVSTDESNLGFVLVNLRTKETNYYFVPGAEEYSAMASAEGLVQEKNYVASFPLLINLNNKPTYLLSLKDAAGLVKMYAFIDVADYQKVSVSDSSLGIEAGAQKFLGEESIYYGKDKLEKTITIKSISNAVIDGNTMYYIVDENNNNYMASIKINKELLPFLRKEDKIAITYREGKVSELIKIELKEKGE